MFSPPPILSLNYQTIERVNHRYVSQGDRFFRMFAGLSSDLTRYEDGIIYLRAYNSEKVFSTNPKLGRSIAERWKKSNPELKSARAYFVWIYNRHITTFDTVINTESPKEKLQQVVDDLKTKYPQKNSHSLYIGVL